MIILIFILIIILLTGFSKKGSQEEMKINKILIEHNEHYISDIISGNLVLTRTPVTYTAYKLKSFPYLKYILSYKDLERIFKEVPGFKLPILDEKYKASAGEWLDSTFAGSYVTLKITDWMSYYFTSLVDYFQEECRMYCKRVNAKSDFHVFFAENKRNMERMIKKPITYQKILDSIYSSKYTLCSEFDPIWLTNMIPIFEKQSGPIKNMLDMSAGRGARMMACAALGINYLGIDPCECAHKNFPLMKKYVKHLGVRSAVKFIKSGFEENWEMPKFFEGTKFDLMFTSPPYFDLEIYEDTPGQSIKKFNNLENWLENFLKVCMRKILDHLRPGGIMAMNIDNPIRQTMDYVNPMLKFEFEDAVYLGCIRISYKQHYHTWCWQKK
jgi:tRNA1(Val) A37 N6-methylase TrmN6